MKIYGYTKQNSEILSELSEVTISTSPKTLRELSLFLNKCADEIETNDADWEHKHFESKSLKSISPIVIVFNEDQF